MQERVRRTIKNGRDYLGSRIRWFGWVTTRVTLRPVARGRLQILGRELGCKGLPAPGTGRCILR